MLCMRKEIKEYIQLFNKTLNLTGICWWVIDYKEDPDYFYCNDFMVETFNLDKDLEKHSVAATCPIAGDYNKNIEIASKSGSTAQQIFDDYSKLVKEETKQYYNIFPYYNSQLNKTMYFSSRATVLDRTHDNKVSILYGIIEDMTTIEEQKIELHRMSITDRLTKLYNRHKLDEVLISERKRFHRYGYPIGIILLDIDHFKRINDTYGHLKGDYILSEYAKLLRQNTRDTDTIGRWGGEEFLLICPNTDINGLKIQAEKLRIIIEKFSFNGIEKVTASFGVSCFKKNDTIDSAILRTDRALYVAKHNGRNRVEIG